MASYYSFKAMVPVAQVSTLAVQTFLEQCEASEVVGSVKQGDGDTMGAILCG